MLHTSQSTTVNGWHEYILAKKEKSLAGLGWLIASQGVTDAHRFHVGRHH
jgi:hypothetical protein